jgi:hypothetical protein
MLKDAINIIATTPEKIRRELAEMSTREMKTRPTPGKWSVQEIVAHLDDVEYHGFRARIDAMLEEDNPVLPRFDQQARVTEMRYDRKDPKRTLASFSRQRRANVRWLRKLRPAQLKRRGIHEEMGEMSAEEFVYEWAFHDLGHLKQILEIKRYGLYPLIGNMRKYYRLA